MRETKSITISSGKEVVFNSYLTGKEAREIQKVFLKNAATDGTGKVNGFNALAVTEAEELALKFLIVSIGGVPENASTEVENLPESEYREVMKAINSVTKTALQPSDFLAQ